MSTTGEKESFKIDNKIDDSTYQSIINTSRDGIMLLKPVKDAEENITDFTILFCNSYAIEVGKLPQDAVGRTLLELLPHLKDSEQFQFHQFTMQTGEPVRFETSFRLPDGKEYGWYIVSLTKVEGAIVSTFIDISERKKFEQTILQQTIQQEQIINGSLNGIFTCEAVRNDAGEVIDLRYTQINDMYRKTIGLSDEDVLGKTMLELFPYAEATGVFEKHLNVLKTGKPARFDVRYDGDGLDAWFDISTVKINDNSIMVTFSDIMEQKKVQFEIQQQKELLDSILKNSSNGISVTEVIRNEAGEIIDAKTILANDAAVKFTGLPRELFLSKTAVELDPGIIGSPYYQLYLKTLQTGEPSMLQYYFDFTERWLELTISKLDDDHVIHIFTDVTATKQTQLQLEKTLEELKRSNQSLEEFAYAASHDLQEPLRKIKTFSDRLKNELQSVLSEHQNNMFQRIESATERMRNLITDLLAYSAVSVKPEQFLDVALKDVVKQIITDYELLIAETNAEIIIKDLPVVKGDRLQLRQMFQNLISNSLKYRKPGIAPKIEISSVQLNANSSVPASAINGAADDYYHIEISDNGIGFDQEHAEKIFRVFERLHGRAEYEGTGVGLAIVNKVVANHKGLIEAEGKPGEGAKFRISFPK